jgi:outer membrane lipoprotein LolB
MVNSRMRTALLMALHATFTLLLCGCAASRAPASGAEGEGQHWQGKLAVKVYSAPIQAFSANFDLQGTPGNGQLALSSPLGTTLARLEWNETRASMRSANDERHYESLDALALEVTGADIPVANLFAWLQGQTGAPSHWVADLSQLDNGRILAHNVGQSPQSELKILLER